MHITCSNVRRVAWWIMVWWWFILHQWPGDLIVHEMAYKWKNFWSWSKPRCFPEVWWIKMCQTAHPGQLFFCLTSERVHVAWMEKNHEQPCFCCFKCIGWFENPAKKNPGTRKTSTDAAAAGAQKVHFCVEYLRKQITKSSRRHWEKQTKSWSFPFWCCLGSLENPWFTSHLKSYSRDYQD